MTMLAEDLRHPCISLSVKPPAPPMHRPHYIAPRTLPPGHRATVGFPTEHSVPGTLPPVGCPQYTAPGAMPPAVPQGDLCAPARSGGSRRIPAGAPVDCCRPALAPLQAPPARRGARAAARPGSSCYYCSPCFASRDLKVPRRGPGKKKTETCKVRPFRDLKTPCL